MKHLTIDGAIEGLRRVREELPGDTPLTFGDGSPVMLVVTDGKELTPDKLDGVVVQVRLDKAALAGGS